MVPGRTNVAEMRGVDQKHLYVAWCESAEVSYVVTQDQPAIRLVGVRWSHAPDDPDGGNSVGDYPLAA
jgi:hypothetical protein